jgi:hypothetical protein
MFRTLGVVLLAHCLVPVPALAAQLSARLHLGAVASTSLIRDSVLRPLAVEPELALAATAAVGWRLSSRFVADGELGLTRADLVVRDGSTERPLTAVTTLSLTAGVTVPLVARATARLGIGGIRYFPADDTGIFAQGGSTSVVGSAAVAYRWPLSPRLELGAEVRYDLHTFSTAELQARGFDGTQTVHRIGFGISVGHRWGE